MPELLLLRERAGGGAVGELALSHALLDRVAGGWAQAAARLYRPGPTLAFGRMDAFRPGFEEAVAVAREHGFDPVIRGPGGKAAAYHEGSVVLELAVADDDPRSRIGERFEAVLALVVDALAAVGVDAAGGELPGEYCPGRFSVIASDVKLGGIAQRVVAGASLTSVAIVVEDGERVRSVLDAVSASLGYAFDPATAGAVADLVPRVGTADVEAALERAVAGTWDSVRITPIDETLREAAATRASQHLPVSAVRGAARG